MHPLGVQVKDPIWTASRRRAWLAGVVVARQRQSAEYTPTRDVLLLPLLAKSAGTDQNSTMRVLNYPEY